MTSALPGETQPWRNPQRGDVLTLRDGRRWTVREAGRTPAEAAAAASVIERMEPERRARLGL